MLALPYMPQRQPQLSISYVTVTALAVGDVVMNKAITVLMEVGKLMTHRDTQILAHGLGEFIVLAGTRLCRHDELRVLSWGDYYELF